MGILYLEPKNNLSEVMDAQANVDSEDIPREDRDSCHDGRLLDK